MLWVCVIWGHSLVPGSSSDAESLAVLDRVAPFLTLFGLTGQGVMNFVVRKAGHFLEYLVLGWIATHTNLSFVGREGRWSRASACLLGVAVAAIDESIQLFVPGRSGQLTDVLLDATGVVCGVALAIAINTLRERQQQKASKR